MSQEEQEEQELALAIAASLSDSQSSSYEPGEAAGGAQLTCAAAEADTVETLSESDAVMDPNDASEESDFDGASDEDEYEETDHDDDDDDHESEGEDEGAWQADEEADNPTGFGKPKPKSSNGKALPPPKRKDAPTSAPDKKKARGQQETPLLKTTEAGEATACTGGKSGRVRLQQPPAACMQVPTSPVVSQLRSPADPAAACPTAGIIPPAAAAAAATGLDAQAIPPALDEPCSPPSLAVENAPAEGAASNAAQKVASPDLKPRTGNRKSVLMPMKQAPRHTGLPSGYKEQAAWTVQGAGLKRSSTGRNRLQGGGAVPVGGGRGIRGLGKSRAPAAGLKRGIKGRTGFVAPKPVTQR
eukprot:COSAG02_NODE_8879_length_2411_cov_1.155642_2_plen_358_part_00